VKEKKRGKRRVHPPLRDFRERGRTGTWGKESGKEVRTMGNGGSRSLRVGGPKPPDRVDSSNAVRPMGDQGKRGVAKKGGGGEREREDHEERYP